MYSACLDFNSKYRLNKLKNQPSVLNVYNKTQNLLKLIFILPSVLYLIPQGFAIFYFSYL